jgi:hypothetical protein
MAIALRTLHAAGARVYLTRAGRFGYTCRIALGGREYTGHARHLSKSYDLALLALHQGLKPCAT